MKIAPLMAALAPVAGIRQLLVNTGQITTRRWEGFIAN